VDSEVFPIEELVASLEDNIASIAEFVLLTDVAHVEELLVVLDEEGTRAVQVSEEEHRGERPDHKFLNHEHANYARKVSYSEGICEATHVHIIAILSACNIGPVLLCGALIVTWLSLKDVLVEELHPQGEGGMMILWDASVPLIQVVEVVVRGCLQLGSQQDCHFLIF